MNQILVILFHLSIGGYSYVYTVVKKYLSVKVLFSPVLNTCIVNELVINMSFVMNMECVLLRLSIHWCGSAVMASPKAK